MPALDRGAGIGAEVIQVFTQSPRTWKPQLYADEILSSYREAQRTHPSVRATYCHASYLINLATSDPLLLERSVDCLSANAAVASAIGASGLILHVGSHKGAGIDSCLDQIAQALSKTIEVATCPLLLENTAGGGGSVGRDFDELARIIDRVGVGPEHIGICLDTQHLWASGTSYATLETTQAALAALGACVSLDRLQCIHFNDSKTALGSNHDRHENLGEGSIGSDALAIFIGHPSLQQVPAILEVPGDGKGPRFEDVAIARRLHAKGRKAWSEHRKDLA